MPGRYHTGDTMEEKALTTELENWLRESLMVPSHSLFELQQLKPVLVQSFPASVVGVLVAADDQSDAIERRIAFVAHVRLRWMAMWPSRVVYLELRWCRVAAV